MPDLDGDMSFAADAHGLVDGGQNAGAFIAHVGGVNAAELGRSGSESDQLFGFGVGSGGVFKRSRDADRAVAHGLTNELFHLLKLRGCGLHVVAPEPHTPDARGAYIAGQIDPHALLFEPRKIFTKCPPIGVNSIVLELFLIGAENGVIQRGDRFALAGDFRGDSLVDLRGEARIYQDGDLRLSKHVDETGSNNHAARINGAIARRLAEIADEGDLATANSNIA